MFGGFPFGGEYFGDGPGVGTVTPPVEPPPTTTAGAGRQKRRRIPRFEWRPSARKRVYVPEIRGSGLAIRSAGRSYGVGTTSLVSGTGTGTRSRARTISALGRNLPAVLAEGCAIGQRASSRGSGRRVLDTRWEEQAVALLLLDD